MPYDFPANDYVLRVAVSIADGTDEGDEVSQERTLQVAPRSKYIFKSYDRWNFGRVVDEETPRSDQIIIVPRNPDAGDLLWRVTEFPAKWLELIEPSPDPLDPSRSVEVTNTGFLRFRVSKDALLGNFSDEVVVTTQRRHNQVSGSCQYQQKSQRQD